MSDGVSRHLSCVDAVQLIPQFAYAERQVWTSPTKKRCAARRVHCNRRRAAARSCAFASHSERVEGQQKHVDLDTAQSRRSAADCQPVLTCPDVKWFRQLRFRSACQERQGYHVTTRSRRVGVPMPESRDRQMSPSLRRIEIDDVLLNLRTTNP